MESKPTNKPLRYAVLTAVAVGAAAAFQFLSAPSVPSTEWTVQGAGVEPYETVEMDAPVHCQLELPAPAYVYAAIHDLTRGTLAAVPSEFLRSNLPTGRWPAGSYALPGRHLDKPLSWGAGDAQGVTTFVVVVSEKPQPNLEFALGTMRQVGNAAFPTREILGTYTPPGTTKEDRTFEMYREPPTPVLQAAMKLGTDHDGAMQPFGTGVWISALRVRIDGDAPKNQSARDIARKVLEDRLGESVMIPDAPSVPR